MDRAALEALSKEQLIDLILPLVQRVAELEAKLGLPAKTPDNSSVPPSQGRKGSNGGPKSKRRRKPRPGRARALDPHPTERRAVRAECCPHCRTDVCGVPQTPCETYDHIDIPPVAPHVTRVSLHGGICPHCAKRFKAAPPAGMAPGSPFGANLRALVLHLRYSQNIAFKRLAGLLRDLYGLTISEGALINMARAATAAFAAQTARLRARLLAGPALASDETGLRVAGRNAWLWVVHHADSAVFLTDPSRAKRVLGDFLDGHRPEYWISDRYGGQRGFATTGHQFCLAHLIRDAQYAVDAGDTSFAPGFLALLKRACHIGATRDQRTDRQLAACHRKLVKALSDLMLQQPTVEAGVKFQRAIGKIRRNLFLFVTNPDLAATNNESERSLRPTVTFRKVTGGFRTAWGAALYADIRSVLETARRRALPPLQAIALTLQGRDLHLQLAEGG